MHILLRTVCVAGVFAAAATGGQAQTDDRGDMLATVSHVMNSLHHLVPIAFTLLGILFCVAMFMPRTLQGLLGWTRSLGGSRALQARSHPHTHDHGDGGHAHTHGVIDATIASTDRGIWAIKWSFVILMVTAAMQAVAVAMSGSVALLADLIHNIGDAGTAIPLWIAFVLARRRPTARFPNGLGRAEDLAGLMIVLIILFSAIVAGTQAFNRLLNPQPLENLGILIAAGIAGFVGNEVVAVLRIRVGREIASAALIADGHHARIDGLTSLAVVAGAVGVWLGFPLADPIIGLLITVAIFGIVWQSARSVLTRMLDGLEPGVLADVRHAADHVPGVALVDVRARWVGHKLHVDAAIAADHLGSHADALAAAAAVRAQLFAHLPALALAHVRFALPHDELTAFDADALAVHAQDHGHGSDHDHRHAHGDDVEGHDHHAHARVLAVDA